MLGLLVLLLANLLEEPLSRAMEIFLNLEENGDLHTLANITSYDLWKEIDKIFNSSSAISMAFYFSGFMVVFNSNVILIFINRVVRLHI